MNWYKIAENEEEKLEYINRNINMFQEPDQKMINQLKHNGKNVEVLTMTPNEYLDRIAIGFWRAVSKEFPTLEEWREDMNDYRLTKSKIENYKKEAIKGSQFPVPIIFYGPNKMEMQEGHHRAEVARQLGIEEMPVIVVNDQYKDNIVTNMDTVKNDQMIQDYLSSELHWEQLLNNFYDYLSWYSKYLYKQPELDDWYSSIQEDEMEKYEEELKQSPNMIKWYLSEIEGYPKEELADKSNEQLWQILVNNNIVHSYNWNAFNKLAKYPENVFDYLRKKGMADVNDILTIKGYDYFTNTKHYFGKRVLDIYGWAKAITNQLGEKQKARLCIKIGNMQ